MDDKISAEAVFNAAAPSLAHWLETASFETDEECDAACIKTSAILAHDFCMLAREIEQLKKEYKNGQQT
jgi:hypothetical protein